MTETTPIGRLVSCGSDETLGEAALLGCLFRAVLETRFNVLSVKDYRLGISVDGPLPVTPCLDHEAQIHEHEVPHLGCYVQHRRSARIAAVTYMPFGRRILVEEEQPGSGALLQEIAAFLGERFVDYDVRIQQMRRGSAYLRAREAAEAHVPLEEILVGTDHADLRRRLDELAGISLLMEKESRVTSWGMRTAYAPLMAAVAFVLVLAFPVTDGALDLGGWVRIGCLLLIGTAFLYYGLKAVQLTKTATRLNKRIQEYRFILAARTDRRPREADPASPEPSERIARIEALLADEKPATAIARLFTARRMVARAALGEPVPGGDPLVSALCDLRLEAITAQERSLKGEIEALPDDRTVAGVVARRARLEEKGARLEAKAAQLRRLA